MHETGIVAHNQIGRGQDHHRLIEGGAAAQIDRSARAGGANLFADLAFLRRAHDPYGNAFGGQRRGKLAEGLRRPAFGGPVFGAGTKANQAWRRRESQVCQHPRALIGPDLELRVG